MATVKKIKALSIVSSREGFRRAGRTFGKDATVIPLSELSRAEIALLEGEAMLVVTEIEVEAADDKAAE